MHLRDRKLNIATTRFLFLILHKGGRNDLQHMLHEKC